MYGGWRPRPAQFVLALVPAVAKSSTFLVRLFDLVDWTLKKITICQTAAKWHVHDALGEPLVHNIPVLLFDLHHSMIFSNSRQENCKQAAQLMSSWYPNMAFLRF